MKGKIIKLYYIAEIVKDFEIQMKRLEMLMVWNKRLFKISYLTV